MKNLNCLFPSTTRAHARRAFLAGLAALGAVALSSSPLLTSAQAGDHRDRRGEDAAWLLHLGEQAQVAELDQLLADFHGALSYGGNMTAMMSLWANNSSLTFNGAPNVGNAAVQSFFAASGYFHNNWVSLAPEYKTQVTLHGDKADLSTQCVAVDLSVTPNVVRAVIQVNATAVLKDGKWLFTSMNNTSPAPL